MAWTTRAPAKVNLDLRLIGKRADGYHEVCTLLQSIALADTLTLTPATAAFALSCETPGVPTDGRNLAWQGAAAMARHLDVRLDGWHLHLHKEVPAEAGLGGGSADAVAAARLLAQVNGARVAGDELAHVLRPLGADVAFFATGGTAAAEGIGDVLCRWPDLPAAAVVLVRPAFGIATRDAYGWYDKDQAQTGQRRSRARPSAFGHRPSGGGARLWGAGDCASAASHAAPAADWPALWPLLGNDLEPAVAARHPEIARIVTRLRDAGAWLAGMSGSGSACFGLFPPDHDTSALAGGWLPGARVWHTRLLTAAEYATLTAVQAR